ncbi:MAG: InlB B-repeat-containing protein [Oscillospiraceae bacterium]|nr:InlB B-repeat-containing protein [Oscillospiraceae bacterium]
MNRLMTYGKRIRKDRRGFTLAEALIAVGILVILLALLIPNLVRIRKELRQKELDAKAELIYIAAQNELVKLRSEGSADVYYENDNYVYGTPSHGDWDPEKKLYYITSGDELWKRIFKDVLDDGTGQGFWVVEYDRESGTVYSVFYSEKDDFIGRYEDPGTWGALNALRSRRDRLNDGARIGYYHGGTEESSAGDTFTLRPTITVNNGERLSAYLQCTAQNPGDSLTFKLTIRDEFDHVCELSSADGTLPTLSQSGTSFYCDLTLDDLRSPARRFNALFGSESSLMPDRRLTPGSRLTLTLEVHSPSKLVNDGSYGPVKVNSLFGDDTDSAAGRAVIECGRHLQNLDASSGVGTLITSAEQTRDIDLKTNTGTGSWMGAYGDFYFNGHAGSRPNFKPIRNDALAEYDGGGRRIAGLRASAERDAGLFGVFGGKLKDIRMTDCTVSGENAGALAGMISGPASQIENCRVYLERADFLGKTESTVWISGGSAAGGLVGAVNCAMLSVDGSFAATVISAGESGAVSMAGGLIGSVESGTLDLMNSYADCYITARRTGGLVGGGAVDLIENCYSAGFQNGAQAAGFVPDAAAGIRNSYTVCLLNERDGAQTWAIAKNAGYFSNVYYLSEGSADAGIGEEIGTRDSAGLQAAMGSAFQTDTGDTLAYNLRDQGLTTYPYPRLTVSRHYGDWQASFQAGALVYYEKYRNADRTYGFYGANVKSTLTESGSVVGDGYGFVFRADGSPIPASVTVTPEDGEAYELSTARRLAVVDPETGTRFYIVPLPKESVNAPPTARMAEKFYGRISASVSGKTEVYAFNPHFAKTVITMQNISADVPAVEQVLIRTPRHLKNLSSYYDGYYSAVTASAVFRQERNMSYGSYDWAGFSEWSERVYSQLPIGRSAASPFIAEYDGGCYTISDVSFITDDGDYVGMFGCNGGILRNIVLATDYDPAESVHFFVQRTTDMKPNVPVYMGVLAGRSDGTIDNCAVAGYYISGSDGTLHAYENCTLYVGGLVGGNSGVIENCAADCPEIRLSSVFANVSMGGFAGLNMQSGSIQNSYALGFLKVTDSRGGSVHVAGFAGNNGGQADSCYCATAIEVSGLTSTAHGFAPTGGLVTNCFYLNNGTYSYVGALRSFTTPAKDASGKALSSGEQLLYGELQSRRSSGAATWRNSRSHPNTPGGNTAVYPFRAVVRDRNNLPVHYGDWPTMPQLGAFGLFYWERETGGANDGYHITYLGVTDTDETLAGSSLCTAHDDDGRIAEFGYGYYHADGRSAEVTGITGLEWSGKERYNTAAAAALRSQIRGYTFYPFSTRVASEGDYIYLDNGESTAGSLTLSDGTLSRSFTLTPFFANAMQCAGAGSVTTEDGRTVDFSAAPGSSVNTFEIRSVTQLQYINWNTQTRGCDTLVNKENRTRFPFIQYATNIGVGLQSKADVLSFRPVQYWKQSHDVSGDGFEGYTPIAGMGTSSPTVSGEYENFLYAWFGGSYDGQSYKIKNLNVISPSYSVGLFGVTLGADLRNVIMFSDNDACVERRTAGTEYENRDGAYNLGGLVGVAYEYKSTSIDNKLENCAVAGYCVTDSSTNRQGAGTANVGGLVGLAGMNLSRCSAVTDIQIACTHEHGHMVWGSFVRVGGLAGSAGTPRAPGETAAQSAALSVSDCYTGGSVSIAPTTLYEMPTSFESDGYANRDKNNSGKSVNIFVSGMIGGSYALNMCNITGFKTSKPDGTATINNCYTYLQLPSLEGSVRAVSLFANQGDRYGQQGNGGTVITLNNCYYLDSIKENVGHPDREDPTTWPQYFFRASKTFTQINSAPTAAQWTLLRKSEDECTEAEKTERRTLIDRFKELVISDEEFEAMLQGDLTCLTKYLYAQGPTTTKAAYEALMTADGKYDSSRSSQYYKTRGTAAQAVSYDTLHSAGMAGALGENWDLITVSEPGGAAIDGKYSFSSLDSQEGKNYPFPTVVRQPDLSYGGEVNIHYGRWPIIGYFWANGRDSMDIFADMKDSGFAEKTFYLNYAKNEGEIPEGTEFRLEPDDLAEIVECVPDNENRRYEVTIRANGVGAVRVIELNTDASFSLNITGELRIDSDPAEMYLFHGTPQQLQLTAKSAMQQDGGGSEGADYTDKGVWELISPDENLLKTQRIADRTAAWTVTGQEPGLRALTANFSYDYHGLEISETAFVSVRTYGYIGLITSDTDAGGKNRAVSAKRSADGGAVAENEPGVYGGTPAMPVPAQFAIFATDADGDLASFRVDGVTVKAGKKTYGLYPDADEDSPYELEFHLSGTAPQIYTEQAGAFRYRCASLRYSGEGEAPGVTLTVSLTDPNGVGRYEFSLPVSSVPRFEAAFDGGTGAEGTMRSIGVTGNSVTLPDCAFTRTGYGFAGWLCGETIMQPGEVLDNITENTTVTAQWAPNTYTVRFSPNGGRGTMESIALVYDGEAAALPACAFTPPAATPCFFGWNTEPDGLGEDYADGEAVRNIASGGEITLYAQWQQSARITLVGSGSVSRFAPRNGSDVLFDDPEERPDCGVREGWDLDGWYTAASMDGVRVLDEDGRIVADADGIAEDGVFAMTDDMTLYARWTGTVFVPIDVLEGETDENARYLIANSAEEGECSLMANADTVSDVGNFTSVSAEVLKDSFYDDTGAYLEDQSYISDDASIGDSARWKFVRYGAFSYKYAGTTYSGREFYNIFNCNGLSIRDHGTSLRVRLDNDSNDRNEWTYNADRPGVLWSYFATKETSRDKSINLSSSGWTVTKNMTCVIFGQKEVYSFGHVNAEG